MPLILIGNPDARVLNLEVDLLFPLFHENSYPPAIGRILDGVLQEALQDFLENPLIYKYAKILFPFHEKADVPVCSVLAHLLHHLLDEGKQADELPGMSPVWKESGHPCLQGIPLGFQIRGYLQGFFQSPPKSIEFSIEGVFLQFLV